MKLKIGLLGAIPDICELGLKEDVSVLFRHRGSKIKTITKIY